MCFIGNNNSDSGEEPDTLFDVFESIQAYLQSLKNSVTSEQTGLKLDILLTTCNQWIFDKDNATSLKFKMFFT